MSKVSLRSEGSIRKRPIVVATIPAYNEERMIAKVIIEAQEYVDKVIVVDDGSTDLTAEIADRLGAKVVRHQSNLGYGAAIKSCLESGYKERAAVVVTIDADGQHRASDIPVLSKQILEGGSDLVIGSRFSGIESEELSNQRKFGIQLISRIVSTATRSKLKDAQSGLRAYSRRALEAIIPDLLSDGMSVSSEILMKAKERRLDIKEVPVEVFYNTGGRTSSKNSIRHGGGIILSVIELVAEKRPLIIFGVPGLASLTTGIVTLLIALSIFNETGVLAIGTALLSVGATIVGLLMVFSAIILYSLSRWRRQLENYTRMNKR